MKKDDGIIFDLRAAGDVKKKLKNLSSNSELNKYFNPLSWVVPSMQIAGDASKYTFVEVFYLNKNKYKRIASAKWWLEHGDSDHIDKIKSMNIDFARLEESIAFPIDERCAKYMVEFDDVSTINDKNHWVLRGRITVRRAADEFLLLEYIGFLPIEIY